jgi:hypothetical protein
MPFTVDDLLKQIETFHLMPGQDFAAMKARWLRPGRKEVEDPARFCEWLRENDYLTRFVLSALARGKADQLTLDQYRLTDLLRTGAQAGHFLAADPTDRAVCVQVVSPAVAQDPAWSE